MKNYIKGGVAVLIAANCLWSCTDERSLAVAPDTFEVTPSDYLKLANDTVIINVNDKVTFNFNNGCPDEILFYSGESGFEYRFGNRSAYKSSDNTTFESKITINTAVNSFDATIAKDYSLVAIPGLGVSSVPELIKATKIELMKLRSSSSIATLLKDSFVFNSGSKPLDIAAGNLNFAILAKSADATKNMLSITTNGFVVSNTEIRDYGYVRNGVTVVNKKTVAYPIVSNTPLSAGWSMYIPDSTIAPGSSLKVANATGYAWLASSNSYPISVTVPTDASKIVTDGSPSESMLIGRAFNPSTVLADVATVIKKVDQSSIKYYQYIYKEKGVYKASFVGLNVGTNGAKKVVREVVILVQ
ncbi:MAG: DUF5017 domain-containing protein [Bacteroidales bacterium]